MKTLFLELKESDPNYTSFASEQTYKDLCRFVVLTEVCPTCKGTTERAGCKQCEGIGEILTQTAMDLLNFLKPTIKAMAREIAEEEIEKYIKWQNL